MKLTKYQRLDDVVRDVRKANEADEDKYLNASDEDMAQLLVDAGLIREEHLREAGRNMWIFSCYNEVGYSRFLYHWFLSGFMANPDNE